MANSVDPDQTAPIGAVCSGSTLFASILNLSVMLGNYLQKTSSADDIFRCIFFLGALRVKANTISKGSGEPVQMRKLFVIENFPLLIIVIIIIDKCHYLAGIQQKVQVGLSPFKDLDQPTHPRSLIKVFKWCSMGSQGSNVSSSGKLKKKKVSMIKK